MAERTQNVSGVSNDGVDDEPLVQDEGGEQESGKGKLKIGNFEIDAKSAESAIQLYRALQDPETGAEIVESLARRAGLLDKKGNLEDTSQSDKKIEGKIKKALKAKLGKDYEQFSELVGDVLDEAVKEYVDEIKESGSRESRANSWNSQVEKFLEDHVLTEDIEDKMKELMDEAPPNTKSSNFDPQRYLRRMYKNALEDLEIEEPEPPKKKSGTSRKSRNDDAPDFVERKVNRPPTVDEAIDAALKGIRLKY